MGRGSRAQKTTPSINSMQASYRNARDVGDKEEEAKWANQIGNSFKEKGEYVTALNWFRKDYDISSSNGKASKLMPTCQCMGEIYLRLENYEEALNYQEKHVKLAELAGDLVEQQRASTQLGRTLLELYEANDTLSALGDAQAHFETSLVLARRLRANPPPGQMSPSAFVVEQVDAYNNLGLTRSMAEDHKQAYKFYMEGLKLCDEEEVDANDAARSRIHHNLGRLYSELRDFEKAKSHTEKDIEICQNICHAQGEAKGLINLGNLYFKSRDYDQGIRCNKRALHIAQTLEDEDNLCSQIKSNLEVMSRAKAKSKCFDADMQKLSKVRREKELSKGTALERNLIKQECALLVELTGSAEELQAWDVHLGLAKRLKGLAKELGDNERLGDALEIVASSYYNLRNFPKAIKWHRKSFELCKRIAHFEGQIVAKINYGNALDASGNSQAAIAAYSDALEAAKSRDKVKMFEHQINALNNLHYCYLVRLQNLDEARKIELQLVQLKHATEPRKALDDDEDERCSETGSEGGSETSKAGDHVYVAGVAPRKKMAGLPSQRSRLVVSDSDDEDDNLPLSSSGFRVRGKRSFGDRSNNDASVRQEKSETDDTELHAGRLHGRRQEHSIRTTRRQTQMEDRRSRLASDDEINEPLSVGIGLGRRHAGNIGTKPIVLEETDSDGEATLNEMVGIGARRRIRCPPRDANLRFEESLSTSPRSRKKRKSRSAFDSEERTSLAPSEMNFPAPRPASSAEIVTAPERDLRDIPCDNDLILSPPPIVSGVSGALRPDRAIPTSPLRDTDSETHFSRHETSAAEPALNLGRAARISPIEVDHGVQQVLPDPGQTVDNARTEQPLRSSHAVYEMANAREAESGNSALVAAYLALCSTPNSSTSPKLPLVEKLQSQKASEEVIAAGCNLKDSDALPLLTALREHEAFSLLDLSHNLLGNSSVHAIQELIKFTNQTDLGLTLDLHSNKLGAGALLQICRCPVSLSRLEVINLSNNRLTDAAARHLSKILKESQALAALNVESCGLTTRSIRQLTTALHPESSLSKLAIGRNNPIAGFAIQELLDKLSTLTSFSELDLKGLELDDEAIAGVFGFIQKSKSLSCLVLQATGIRNDGALALADALEQTSLRLTQLDVSINGFNGDPAARLYSQILSMRSLLKLNLCGNNIDAKAAEVVAEGLARSNSRLKSLNLSNCGLGQQSILLVLKSLKGQETLLDLNVSGNIAGLLTSAVQTDRSSVSVPCVSRKESEVQGEVSSTQHEDCMAVTSAHDYDRGLESRCGDGDGLRADSDIAGACSDAVNVQAHQFEGAAGETLWRSTETSAFNLTDGVPGMPAIETVDRAGPSSDVDCNHQVIGDGEERVACHAKVDTQGDSKPILAEAVVATSGPEKDSTSVLEGPPEVDCISVHGTTPGADYNLAEDSHTTTRAGHFREQLATAIQMAKGLRQLDLSGNELDENDKEALYSAWSAVPRGGSHHQHHVTASLAHFFVQDRPCACFSPQQCCSSH